MNRILNKRRMYELLQTGRLGNSFRVWESIEDFESSGFRGLTGVRTTSIDAPYRHHLTPYQGLWTAALFEDMGYDVRVYEASPDRHIVLQGEFMWDGDWHLWLRCSRAKTQMREALGGVDNRYLDGRVAEVTLRRAVGQRAWADFVWLSLTYLGHVIEFTAYDKPVGIEGSLTVTWECRAY